MTIKSELLHIAKKHGGLLQAPAALEWAKRNPDSKLYKSICWDDEKAAHEYRLSQVRHLIAIHIVDASGDRQMVSLIIDRVEPGGGYRHLDDVLRNEAMRAMLLDEALADLERVRLRYEHVKGLASVWSTVAKVRRKAKSRKKGGSRPSSREADRPSL